MARIFRFTPQNVAFRECIPIRYVVGYTEISVPFKLGVTGRPLGFDRWWGEQLGVGVDLVLLGFHALLLEVLPVG